MALKLPPYSGWKPRALRRNKASVDGLANRSGKRARLSKAKSDRVLYTSSKGYKHNPDRYRELCIKADEINGRRV